MTSESFCCRALDDAVYCAWSLSIFVTSSSGDEDWSESNPLAKSARLTSSSAAAAARCCVLAMMLSSSATFTESTRCNFSTANCAEAISALWCGPSLAGTRTVKQSSYGSEIRTATSTPERGGGPEQRRNNARTAEQPQVAQAAQVTCRSCCNCHQPLHNVPRYAHRTNVVKMGRGNLLQQPL